MFAISRSRLLPLSVFGKPGRNARFRAMFVAVTMLLFSGCFHKDVMTDRADNVVATLLYQGEEGNLIISKESVFQATSKESGGGVTNISGYTEMRLSSYHVATGELAGRVELGDMMESPCNLLGYSPGKIWMYSLDPQIGLHYRDPIKLEVVKSWPQLSEKPNLSALKLAHPEWHQIDQYFGYDWVSDQIRLTDESGFKYELDPNTLDLKRVEADIARVDWDLDITNVNGQFEVNQSIYLEGGPRSVIHFADKKSQDPISFLEGSWMIDVNLRAAADRKRVWDAGLQKQLKATQDSLSVFSEKHPEIIQASPNADYSYELRDLRDKAYNLQRDFESAQREIDNWKRYDKKVLDYPLITNDKRSAYILHASMISDTAHRIVTRVNLAADSTWSIAWETHLMGIYHNTSRAASAGAFETVFSKGNPEFDYTWATTDGTYLVLILQLHMLAIDMKTGKLAWNIEI